MTSEPKKITELIGKNKFTYSFEVTPDVNIEEIDIIDVEPVFFSVTWHAKSHLCKDLDIQPLKVASYLRSKNYQVLLHLTCDLMKKHYLERVLAYLQEKGISNLFLVLGDNQLRGVALLTNDTIYGQYYLLDDKLFEKSPYSCLVGFVLSAHLYYCLQCRVSHFVCRLKKVESYDPKSSDFKNTSELIKYIREISGQHFCIGIAGFCDCSEEQLLKLKEKVSAGADFVITQAFFETEVFKNFVQKCLEKGITVPIIPGIFVYETYNQLVGFTNMCKVKVSEDLLNYVKNYKEETPGKEIVKNMMNTLLSEMPSINFHIFTLNKTSTVSNFIKEMR